MRHSKQESHGVVNLKMRVIINFCHKPMSNFVRKKIKCEMSSIYLAMTKENGKDLEILQ